MTAIKLCGLSRPCDIEWVNELKPQYIGFVFARKSKRYVSPELAVSLRAGLSKDIKAVGVLVNAPVDFVCSLLESGAIDIPQLHGQEDESYIAELRSRVDCPIIKAFRIDSAADVEAANASSADYVLLDAGSGGTGTSFDWSLLEGIRRPYFLAGGLDPERVGPAVAALHPYGVDVSSGIETDGLKDKNKMEAFVANVRKEDIK